MKNYKLKIITIITLLCWSGLALANSIGNSSELHTAGNYFQIAPYDISIQMLAQIFGNVGIVLPGTPNVLGAMFKQFNIAVLAVIISVIVCYFVIRGVLEQAQHGEFLGKKFDSLWVPIRLVLGLTLIAPLPSGYSGGQALVMYAAEQGVGIADVIWRTVLYYYQANDQQLFTLQQTFVEQTNQADVNDSTTALDTSRAILAGLYCMYSAQDKFNSKTIEKGGKSATYHKYLYYNAPDLKPIFFYPKPSITHVMVQGKPQVKIIRPPWYRIDFQYTPKTTPHATGVITSCGNVQYANPNVLTGDQAYISTQVQDGLKTLIQTLNSKAKAMIYPVDQTNHIQVKPKPVPTLTGANNPIALGASYLNSIVEQATQQIKMNNSNQMGPTNSLTAMSQYGWALAGALYWNLVSTIQLTAYTATLTPSYINTENPNFLCSTVNQSGSRNQFEATACSNLNNMYTDAKNPPSYSSPTDLSDTGLKNVEVATNNTASRLGRDPLDAIAYSNIIKSIQSSMSLVFNNTYIKSESNEQFNTSKGLGPTDDSLYSRTGINLSQPGGIYPVVGLALMGNKLVNAADNLVTVLSWVIGTFAAVAGICQAAQPGGLILLTAIVTELPIIMLFATTTMVLGVMLSVWVPLIIFVVMFFGVIGWFLAVMEMMLATPIFIMGLVFPDASHEVFGHAKPAVILLANVFLKPALLVFGLMFSIILTWVALNFFNGVFYFISAQMLNAYTTANHDISNHYRIAPFIYLGFVGAYAFIATSIITMSSKSISMLSSGVFKFITGGQAAQGAASGDQATNEALQEGKGGTQRAAGSQAQASGTNENRAGQAEGRSQKVGGFKAQIKRRIEKFRKSKSASAEIQPGQVQNPGQGDNQEN